MVQSVQRAVQILQELAAAGRLGVTELADRVGVAKPTVHALLRTLEADKLVTQDHDGGKYMLGPGLVQLGSAYLDTHVLRSRCVPWAEVLASRTGEAVWVGILTDGNVLVIHHALRPQGNMQMLEVGASLPWNTCALGKAIAAFLPPEERQQLLDGELVALTGWSVTDQQTLTEQLEQVRLTGYALEEQEANLGDGSIASPVLDRTGQVVGAIGITAPVEHLTGEEDRARHAATVRDTARSLSREFGAGRGTRSYPAQRAAG
ncbi:IclR family transcriptional regulator [Streptomyces sp. NPDC005728]|uniref:IclR family transcriptional regulator n=1 Tax=Streptomyces sp. NPDC005728 TaxID=3157054 RepID=UPI0034098B82